MVDYTAKNPFGNEKIQFPVEFDLKVIMDSKVNDDENVNTLKNILVSFNIPFSDWRFKQSSAGKYLDPNVFQAAGIELVFFKARPPVYPQLWGPFIPNLSALDLLFNYGPAAHDILKKMSDWKLMES